MGFPGMDAVFYTNLGRIESESCGHQIQLAFNGKTGLGNTVSAHGPAHGFVGIDMIALIKQIGNLVGNHQKKAGKGHHRRCGAVISSAVGVGLKLLRHDGPVFF